VKIGAENKKQVQWMIALLVLALLVGIYNFVDFGSSSAASSPATASAGAQPKKSGVLLVADTDNTLDPRLRIDILAASQSKKYEAGRNIFRMEEVTQIPKMEGTGRLPNAFPPPPPTPTPTPPPPPIPLKFYGFASKANEPKKIFLDDDGEVFIAKQGEIVERRYKVVQINNTSVIIEDALNSNRQTIQVTPK
jgi:hypothetical protein